MKCDPPIVVVGALLLGALMAASCGEGRGQATTETSSATPLPTSPQVRPAAYSFCPDVVPGWLPPDFVKTASQLHALRDNHMGAVVTYADRSADTRQVKSYSGVDPLEIMEDLDFQTRSVRIGGRGLVLSETSFYPRMVVAALPDEASEPCDAAYVVGHGLTEEELLSVLAAVRPRGPSTGAAQPN